MSVEVVYLTAAETRELVTHEQALVLAEQVCRWHAGGQEVWPPEPNVFTMRLPEANSIYRIKMAALTAVPVAGVRVTGLHYDASGVGSAALTTPLCGAERSARRQAAGDRRRALDLQPAYLCGRCAGAAPTWRDRIREFWGWLLGQACHDCLEMLVHEFAFQEIRVGSRRAESRESFALAMSERLGQQVEPLPTIRDVVDGADVVLSATSASEPIISAGWLRAGATFCALGVGEAEPKVYRSVDK